MPWMMTVDGRTPSWGLALVVMLGSVTGSGSGGGHVRAGVEREKVARAREGAEVTVGELRVSVAPGHTQDPREPARGGPPAARRAVVVSTQLEASPPIRWIGDVLPDREALQDRWVSLGETFRALEADLRRLNCAERHQSCAGSQTERREGPGWRRQLSSRVSLYRAEAKKLQGAVKAQLRHELEGVHTVEGIEVGPLDQARRRHWRVADRWFQVLVERERVLLSSALYDVGPLQAHQPDPIRTE